jgi:hypothetical protein
MTIPDPAPITGHNTGPVASVNSPRIDRRPFYWMLAIVGCMLLIMLAFQFAGRQRLHNTALWQRFHPVTLVSPPQTAYPVEVVDTRRIAQAAIQTERGIYFLTGAAYVPPPGSQVVVQTNARWDLFLCAADGSRCMTIHSFCADAVWPNIGRDETGRMAGCFAPHLGTPMDAEALRRAVEPPLASVPGGMGKRKRPPPAVGISHPAEWAWRRGLPAQSR